MKNEVAELEKLYCLAICSIHLGCSASSSLVLDICRTDRVAVKWPAKKENTGAQASEMYYYSARHPPLNLALSLQKKK